MMKKILAILFTVVTVAACQSTDIRNRDGRIEGAVMSGEEQNFAALPGEKVFFAFDSSSLNDEAKEALNKQVEVLKENPTITVTVEGYCDARGTREYNLALGERRANAVKSYLVQKGINANRIGVVSYGKERPAVIGDSEEAYAQNRRAVVVINQGTIPGFADE
jgi:peptidoglycan-associated lipoprotein